ncbi:hypothetical protein [Spirosoma areae]
MTDLLENLKGVPGEAYFVLALFAGSTIHAMRLKQVPVAEGLTGAFISFVGGFFFFKIICLAFSLNLDDVWFLGFPVAYMANYALGGMDTVGSQIRDSPVQTIVSLLGTLVDEVLAKIEKFKTQPPK